MRVAQLVIRARVGVDGSASTGQFPGNDVPFAVGGCRERKARLKIEPDEAEALTLASTEGRIQLALRNTLDVDSVSTRGMRINALVQGPPRRAPRARSTTQARPPEDAVVETYRGGTRTLIKFNKKGG